MNRPGFVLSVLMLVFAGACTDDGDPSPSDTGTETQSATEASTGDGDGDACTPDGAFGDCVNDGLGACMADTALCVEDDPSMPSIGVCGRPCDDACDCWAAPATGDAPVACKALVPATGDGTCVLDCSSGQACPTDMSCLDSLGICVFSLD
jgi:hypothetical protein